MELYPPIAPSPGIDVPIELRQRPKEIVGATNNEDSNTWDDFDDV
jgi:hypothetical protein